MIITCIIYHYNSKDIILKLAYSGASPQNYVAEKLHPENFKRNWEAAGVGKYDFSFPMRVYYYLAKYFGINPTTTMYPFMFIQTLLFLLSVAFLTQTLFQNKFLTIVSVIIIPVSNLAGLDLSRFATQGYGLYLEFAVFYAYANAFRLFALGFFLKNKYILMFIFLALSIYCHVNMGFFAIAFIGGYIFYNPRLFHDKSFIAGLLIFLFLVVPHIFLIISNSAITSGGIPIEQWVKSTRIFGFHWYPITMKLFTKNAHKEFFPFLLLCLFFFVALRYQDVKDEKNVKIILGTIGCLILSVFGIIFSDIYPIPFLIKISFQRSTGLITFFGVIYIIYYLFQKMESGNILNIILATYSLLILIFAKPGIAVLPLFLLLYFDIIEGHFGSLKIESDKTTIVKLCYFTSAFFFLLLFITSIFQNNHKISNSVFLNLWAPLQYFNPFDGFDFFLRGGSFKVSHTFAYLIIGTSLITASIIINNRFRRNIAATILSINIFLVISLSAVWHLESDKYLGWHNWRSRIATSYLDVQLWAKNNTAINTLFMPDPSHSYGWRDFSERSSFGNLREWGYCAIAYNPDYKIYQEGIKRMKEFGIDMGKVTDKELNNSKTFIYGQKLAEDIRVTFYNMKAEQLRAISNKYKIDFIILNKKYHKHKFKVFKVAYENKYYVVYRV